MTCALCTSIFQPDTCLCVCVCQVLLVIGGQAPKAIRSVECFDFKEEKWSQVADMPSRRCRCGKCGLSKDTIVTVTFIALSYLSLLSLVKIKNVYLNIYCRLCMSWFLTTALSPVLCAIRCDCDWWAGVRCGRLQWLTPCAHCGRV